MKSPAFPRSAIRLCIAAVLAASIVFPSSALAQSPWPFSLSDGVTNFGVYLGGLGATTK